MTSSQELNGRVTFTDRLRVEITVGMPPKPDAKLYIDGNPMQLQEGDKVLITITRSK